MQKNNILVVDDDPSVIETLEIILEKERMDVTGITSPERIHEYLRKNSYDVILLDMNFSAGVMTGNEGIYWLREILKKEPEAFVIMITAYGDYELVVKAMKEGAVDFVVKPWENEKLIATINNACKLKQTRKQLKQVSKEKAYLSKEISKSNQEIIGSSFKINDLLETIQKLAPTDANILITGENGTGKELVARKIHELSNRGNNIFINVDLGAINENLFESELFGHKKGAFTDAFEDKSGRFEIASGGSLFLDEIGNIPLSVQSKLLSVLQNREANPVGSNKSYAFDIRLITATNKDLLKEINEETFRKDLFYRINTITIHVPALRERGNDIIQLAEYFLKKYAAKYEKQFLKLTSSAINKLLKYSWPGNVRELMHSVEKAVILTSANTLAANDFILESHANIDSQNWPLKFTEIEKQAIIRALENNKGSIVGAARELGLTRQTLFNKCKKYDIEY
jgi:DNA-binding NtrC family response regulator